VVQLPTDAIAIPNRIPPHPQNLVQRWVRHPLPVPHGHAHFTHSMLHPCMHDVQRQEPWSNIRGYATPAPVYLDTILVHAHGPLHARYMQLGTCKATGSSACTRRTHGAATGLLPGDAAAHPRTTLLPSHYLVGLWPAFRTCHRSMP